jgi:DNA-binding PadR family transcriptional regulator
VKHRLPIHRQAIYDAYMPNTPAKNVPTEGGSLGTFGRYAGPATLILSSLADGAKHGYALTKDIEQFAGIRLAPGTLYEALSRLEGQGLIEAMASEDRRRPYQLTAAGAHALQAHLADQRRVADIGLRRLAKSFGPA